MARKSRRTRRLRVVNPDCAGIDIGKDRHFVAVDPERTEEPVRSFGSFTRDLEAMGGVAGVVWGDQGGDGNRPRSTGYRSTRRWSARASR